MFDDIFSRVDRMHEHDERTDTGRQQRLRLRIALRGYKMLIDTATAITITHSAILHVQVYFQAA